MRQMLYITVPTILLIWGCTYNISMVHTEGTASDVIDTEQEAKPDVKTDLTLSQTGLG